ncbi:efflux transporter outer membrane subunit [Pararobbsia silviterrae]|uniref:Efflux transporter outer membrane subunit n=1 Tax=Pararobbsia silviterrae TaxID=1792498 RepID=A0A494XZG3_9BURK|nr:efflux transporter outer membrane subunit [Pararobbsia silviterrae]RKP55905.1 efflux transporter outer membrane subunit [Pararobbsia silviterrae]
MKPSVSPLLRRCLIATAACAFVAGCTVGPNYAGAPEVAPNATHADRFARAPNAGIASDAAPAQWWTSLDDPLLTRLIETALEHNTDIRAARARLRESRAGLREQQRDALPKTSASAADIRLRAPDTSLLSNDSGSGSSSSGRGPIDLYEVGFDASWEVDLFGGTRRAIEAASDQADASEADLADTHVEIAAEVAQAYVDLRDQQQRLALVRASADLESQMLDLTRQRRTRGVASDLDVERIRTQVETTRSNLIPLDAQITESLDQLALLTGREPGALDAELSPAGTLPVLPETVAVGDPAALLKQRPDIRAAERRLAAQTAQIGEREADWFPKLTLFGDLGFTAADPGHLMRKENFSWVGIPYLQWNGLDFGRVKARVDQAGASRDEAQAQYEGAVLGALRDANVALSRYGHQRENVYSLRSVESSASHTAQLTRQRYQAGVSTALDWLDAERTRYSAEQNRISGDAELVKDYVALQKALGLGWTPPG